MKLVNVKTTASKDALLRAIGSSEEVNRGVKFDEDRGRPLMKLKNKEGSSTLSVTCEMIGGKSKDNGFIIGTFFFGRITEKNGETRLSGMILTDPIFHLLVIAFCIYCLVQSFILKGFTPMPIFIILFTVMIFRDEYKKQGMIERYLKRAARYAEGNSERE